MNGNAFVCEALGSPVGKAQTSKVDALAASLLDQIDRRRRRAVRAEPVAALYEQGKVHHVGVFPALEDQLISFTTNGYVGDPDRTVALVRGLTELSRPGSSPATYHSSRSRSSGARRSCAMDDGAANHDDDIRALVPTMGRGEVTPGRISERRRNG